MNNHTASKAISQSPGSSSSKWLQIYLPYIVTAILVLFAYWGIHNTFYQQDEWQELGFLRSGVISLNPFAIAHPGQFLIGQGRYFSDLILAILLQVTPFRLTAFAVISLLLHLLNTGLVFWLVRRLSKQPLLAAVAALFFAINGVANQSVAWIAAIATLPATSLILLSIHNYLSFLETGEKRNLFWSLGLTFLSLFFKEIGLFLVVFLPLLYYWQQGQDGKASSTQSFVATIRANAFIVGYGIIIILLRLIQLMSSTASNGTISAGNDSFGLKVLFRLILYPLTGLFQTLLPSDIVYPVAKKIAYLQYSFLPPSTLLDVGYQTLITDLLAVMGTFGLIALAFWLAKRAKNDQERQHEVRIIRFSVALTMLSFLPYAILDRGGSYMDSRYYYVAAIGVGILVGYILTRLATWHLAGKIIAALILVTLVWIHIAATKKAVALQVEVGNQRRQILTAIKADRPNLTGRDIFYVTGDRDYDAPNNRVPFQQGVGYTLMVWYGKAQQIPNTLLAEKFLWDENTYGYRLSENRGFGFYNQLDKMKEAIAANQFAPTDVTAYYWDSKKQELRTITDEIRAQLK